MENSFAKIHPELVTEWSEKNLPVTPDDVSYGTRKIYWWKSPCGHEWKTSVKARHAGEKCPICANVRVIPGINDLATRKPELAAQWSDKNEYSASEVAVGSHRKVWWKGPCGHEWRTEIRRRTEYGAGCPYCASRRLLTGFNDLKTRCPEVAREWSPRNDPLRPDMVTAFSSRKVWWKCSKCGYEWEASPKRRTQGTGCRKCAEKGAWKLRREKRIEILKGEKAQEEWMDEVVAEAARARAEARWGWLARVWRKVRKLKVRSF